MVGLLGKIGVEEGLAVGLSLTFVGVVYSIDTLLTEITIYRGVLPGLATFTPIFLYLSNRIWCNIIQEDAN